jgi:hypothetical protein
MMYSIESFDNLINPISGIIYAISRPCSNLNKDYVARPNQINAVFVDTQWDCTFNKDDNPEHSLFYPTNYEQSEF